MTAGYLNVRDRRTEIRLPWHRTVTILLLFFFANCTIRKPVYLKFTKNVCRTMPCRAWECLRSRHHFAFQPLKQERGLSDVLCGDGNAFFNSLNEFYGQMIYTILPFRWKHRKTLNTSICISRDNSLSFIAHHALSSICKEIHKMLIKRAEMDNCSYNERPSLDAGETRLCTNSLTLRNWNGERFTITDDRLTIQFYIEACTRFIGWP